MQKIGLMVGREWSFPPAFIEAVAKRDAGVAAEYVKLGGTRMDELVDYAVIVDRISHEVPYYRTFLKHAALQGVTVVNNPFMSSADDKLLDASLATCLGIATPRTIALPNREYVPGIKHDESLRNLQYPLDWDQIIAYVGLPCILKDAHGGGPRGTYICRSKADVIHHYNSSGLLTMIAQEFIEWDQFVRALAIGQTDVLPMRYDPKEHRYLAEQEQLSAELSARIAGDSRTLMRALGYDMCSLDWAVRDGVPYAVDFMNPVPDVELDALTPRYFEWTVDHMADLAIRLAKEKKASRDPATGDFLLGRRAAR